MKQVTGRYLDTARCPRCGHYETEHGFHRWLKTFGCMVWGCRCRAR